MAIGISSTPKRNEVTLEAVVCRTWQACNALLRINCKFSSGHATSDGDAVRKFELHARYWEEITYIARAWVIRKNENLAGGESLYVWSSCSNTER